jgi:hypothetical protein
MACSRSASSATPTVSGGLEGDPAGPLGRQRRDCLEVGLAVEQRGEAANELEVLLLAFDGVDRLVERPPLFADVALIGSDEFRSQRTALPADEFRPIAATAAGDTEEVLRQHGGGYGSGS